jgi:hypothetical protein
MLAGDEFVFNGRLFLPDDGGAGVVIDNFPKGPTFAGWTRRQRVDHEGYDLVDADGRVLFGYEIYRPRICIVTANVFAADGSMVAETSADGLQIRRGPADIGRGALVIA